MHTDETFLRRAMTFGVFLGLTALASAQLTSAPEPQAPDMDSAQKEVKVERKQPGFFHRPTKNTAAEQMAYATELRAGGYLRRAANEYLALVHSWHEAPEAPTAQFEAADTLMQRGRYARAFDEFQYLFEFFPGRFPYEKALESQFKIANAILEQRHMAFLGMTGFTDPQTALPLFRQLARNAPFWEHSAEVHFRIAWILEETGEERDAVDAYALVMQSYPESRFAGDAAFRRAMCLRSIARSCPRDESQCRAALSAFASYMRDFPKHAGREEAEQYRDQMNEQLATMYYDRALFYDKIAGRPKSAVIAYRDFLQKFPLSSKAPSVTDRIAELAALNGEKPAETRK